MCEINNFVIFTVVISQKKCHTLPQAIKEMLVSMPQAIIKANCAVSN